MYSIFWNLNCNNYIYLSLRQLEFKLINKSIKMKLTQVFFFVKYYKILINLNKFFFLIFKINIIKQIIYNYWNQILLIIY
jgi:hypothetical protein